MDGVKIFKGVSSSLKYILIFLFVLLWISPFLWMVMTSFRDPAEPFSAGLFPQRLVLTNYLSALKRSGLMIAFRNSFFVAGMASIVALIVAIPAGYGFSRYRFKGHGAMMVFLIIMKNPARCFTGVVYILNCRENRHV